MSRFIAAIAGLFLVPSGATGQSAGAVFPVRDLPLSRVESPPFAAVTDVVEVGDNAVLVHDMERRRVVLLDSSLALVRVVLDSVAATTSVHRYGQAPGRLIPYHGDSALFVDQASSSFLLLDADGRVARVMGIPRYQDIGALITGEPPRVDTRNRLVYRLGLRPAAGVARAPASEARGPGALLDTAAIVRVSLESREPDTVAFFKIRQWPGRAVMRDTEQSLTLTRVNPLEPLDDWTVLADGSLAVLRGLEYRVDFVRADGTEQRGAKVPYEWTPLSDSVKAAFIAHLEEQQNQRLERERVERIGKPPLEPRELGALMRRASTGALDVPIVRYEFVRPDELPSYRPAIVARSTHPSPENTMWVRTFLEPAADAGLVYDVLDAGGARVDRVRLPPNRVLAALGRVSVYVTRGDSRAVRLERIPRRK